MPYICCNRHFKQKNSRWTWVKLLELKNKRCKCSGQIVAVQSLNHVRFFAIAWTAALQASLSFTISRTLLKLMSIQSVMQSNHLILCRPFSSCLQSFPASGSIPMTWLFPSGGQSIGASASASVLPMNIQDWFPLGWTGWISLQSEGPSRVFSNTTIQKHQFFGAQPSLWSSSRIHTRLLEKPQLWLHTPLSTNWCLCFLICCLSLS